MKRLVKDTRVLLLCLTLTSMGACDVIEYHPYDGRFVGDRDINANNSRRIEETLGGRDSFTFAVISDTQRWYDETKLMINSINQREEADFVIHCGDQTDFGATKEFTWMRDIFNRLTVPYVCVIGNHDCLGSGESVFQALYGELNFAFTAGNVRFVCMNTNALEYDYSRPVPDLSYMRGELESFPQKAEKTIFAMHVKPNNEQFNDNLAYIFDYYATTFPGFLFSLCGHEHYFSVEDVFGSGNTYYQCPSAKKRSYLVFTITPTSYRYEVVYY